MSTVRPHDAHRSSRWVRWSGTVGGLDASRLRELFETPPPEFVAARNALVNELRRAKDREAATAVAGMRRPGWADWALNVAAMEHADDVAAFAESAATSRDAQAAAIEGRDGPDVRVSMRELRETTAQLARRAGAVLADHARTGDTAELTARLADVAASAPSVDQLRAGLLGSADPGATDPFAGLQPASPVRRSDRSDAVSADRRSGRSSTTRASGHRRGAAEALEQAARDHQASTEQLSEAEAAVGSATAAVAEATQAVTAAERRLADAAKDLARAEQQRNDAVALTEQTKAAHDAAAAAVDDVS